MRYINLKDYTPSEAWRLKARNLSDELARIPKEDRNEFINKHSDIWKALKDDLLNFSHGKCWYTEAKEIASYYHVDHYRPKNNIENFSGYTEIVETINKNEPYWWLAFDWGNYRICGSVPNINKRCYFPLRKDTQIALSKCDICNEFPALLDPTDEDDVTYLDFNEEGRACPAINFGTDTWQAQRVEISIKVYNLNYQSLVDGRIQVYNRCKALTSQIIKVYEDYSRNGNVHARDSYKDKSRELRKMANEESELSATARSYILNSEYSFIRKLA